MRRFWIMVMAGCLALVPAAARPSWAQTAAERAPANTELDINNPLNLLENAIRALPRGPAAAGGSTSATSLTMPGGIVPTAPTAPAGGAGERGPSDPAQKDQGWSISISILVLLTVLTLAPAILVMTTSFTRIVVVLGLLRQAVGTQSLPPSQVIVGLSLFLTLLVMSPTLDRVNREAIVPYQQGQIKRQDEMWVRAKQPLRDFMFAQIEHSGNWDELYMILNYRGIDTSDPGKLSRADVDLISLVPAFILSELKVAFMMGFRLFLPFLIIDMVIASVLISMGMMMLPPVLVSLPFKLLLFVLVDGWRLVAGGLLDSFAVPGVTT